MATVRKDDHVTKRTCTIPECNKPHRARGLCSTHYNEAFQPERHANSVAQSRARRERDKLDPDRRAKERERSRRRSAEKRAAGLPGWRSLANNLPREIDREMDALEPLRYIDCAWCGEAFWTRQSDALCCSRRCKAKASRARRRAVEAGATGAYTWAEVVGVFIAIGKVCAYCHEPQAVADIEPDHVIALSVGGSNSIANVVPSCKLCNSDKRELTLAEWSADRERRGLSPRVIHPGVAHLTLATL